MSNLTPAAAKVGCEIRTSRSDSGAKLNAVVKATGPVSGTYVLNVKKRSGAAVISRSGDFKVEGPSPSEVQTASLDLDPGEAYDASLTIKWPNGSSSCSASLR